MNYQNNIEVKSTHRMEVYRFGYWLKKIQFQENYTLKRYLLPMIILLGLQLPTSLHASHIVGGEMNYTCLGGGEFEIKLSVYRDCFFGSPNAPFDDPASIGIFNQDGNLIQQLLISFVSDDTLDAVLFDECLFVPEEVCVHTTNYTATVSLPVIPGGYRFVYQRCCRNQTIANIIAPDETGATYDVVLTEEAMNACNTNPQFEEWPPVFICVNSPINFDHSASEPDNDSLVYRLCTPSSGASFGNPRPQPPNNPPYDTVVWVAPTFSLDNLLGMGNPLQIDPQTGLLTGLPTLQGQFVVGVCVEEYDRATGNLISTTRRDFQYNVGQCGTVISSINAPDAVCENLEVAIENNSDNANDFQWYFDWPNNTLSATTADANFTFAYPDTGTYTIALIAEPNSSCADTSFHEVLIQSNSLTADFQLDVFDCDTEALVQAVDLSVETVSSIDTWDWTISYNGITQTSAEQNPSFIVPLQVSGTISLTATTLNGCVQTAQTTFETGLDNPGSFIIPSFEACVGETLALNPNTPANTGFNYQWSPADGLDNVNAVNPVLTVANTITYTVTITPENNACQTVREVQVNAVPLPELSFTTSSDCGGTTINFTNTSLNADSFMWDFGDTNTSTEASPTHSYNQVGTYVVSLVVAEGALCRDSISQEIVIEEALLSAGFSAAYDNCSETSVAVQFTDESQNNLDNTVAWSWTFSNGETSDQQNPIVSLSADQTLEATLMITTAEACTSTSTQSFTIDLLDDVSLEDTLLVCFGGSAQLSNALNPNYTYSWSPVEGIDDPTSANPTFNPTATTTYTATITGIGFDTCEIVQELLVEVSPQINLQVSGDNTTCEENTTLVATANVPGSFIWRDVIVNTVLSTTPELSLNVSGSDSYEVVFTDENGCTETLVVDVSGGTVDVAVPDQVAACLGEELIINVDNLDAADILSYTWSPASAFVNGTENNAVPDYNETVGEQMLYVTITNQAGCIYEDSVLAVIVDPNIDLSFESDLECNGATVNFTNTSSNAFGYVWNFGDGTISTEENPTHTYDAVGNYNVTLAIAYDVSCVDTFVQSVDILDPQIIAAFDQDIMDCQINTTEVAFTDMSINSFNNTVSWDWTFSNGLQSDEQNPMITVSESGDLIVTLTITSANDCEASVTDTLNFELIDLDLPDMLTICEGDSTTLNPGGNSNYTYMWSSPETLDDPTIANPTAFPTATTTYTVTVMAFGTDTCAITSEVTVEVAPEIALSLPNDITTCGEDATLTATTNIDADIEWVDSMGEVVGTGAEIMVNPFTVETYTASASDQFGCSETASITVTDNGIDVDNSEDVQGCQSQEVTLSVTNLDPDDVLTHNWSPASNITSATNLAEITATVESGTVLFTNEITNQHGCTETVEINVAVVPFEVDLQGEVAACIGEPVGIAPNADPNFNYEWAPAENLDNATSNNPIYSGTEDQTFSVTITDNSNGVACVTTEEVFVDVSDPIELAAEGDTTLCEIVDVTLNASSSVQGVSLEWSDGNGFMATGNTVTVTPYEGQNTYTVIATDSENCVDTAEVVVSVGLVNTGVQDQITACESIETALNPDGDPNLVYTWSPSEGLDLTEPWNPIVSTNTDQTFTVTITDATGACVIEDTTSIAIFDAINLQIDGGGVACDSTTITFTATTDVDSEINWADASGTGIFEGSTFSTLVTGSTFFTVTAEDENGCMATETVAVDDERINAVITPSATLCVPIDDYTIEVTNLNDDHTLTYSWTPNLTTGPSITVDPVANTTETYAVEVSNQFGCTTTLMSTVQTIVLEDLLDIAASPDTIRLGESSDLEVFDCINCEYIWNGPAGTLDVDDEAIVVATPDDLFSNIYTVIVNQGNCSTELDIEVFVRNTLCEEPHIFLPNAFSPNGDGENDVLRARGSFIESFQLLIYNRWGEEMFATEDINQGWDGTYKGEQLPPDVYGFYLLVNCPNGEVFTKKGSITLLR